MKNLETKDYCNLFNQNYKRLNQKPCNVRVKYVKCKVTCWKMDKDPESSNIDIF
jgi:competence protein ComGC